MKPIAEGAGDRSSAPALSDPLKSATKFVYSDGRAFIEHHHQRGGSEAVWALLATPPRRTTEILRPEEYGRAAEMVGVTAALETVGRQLDATKAKPVITDVGALRAAGMVPSLVPAQKDAFQQRFIEGALLKASDPGGELDALLCRFKPGEKPAVDLAAIDAQDRERATSARGPGGEKITLSPATEWHPHAGFTARLYVLEAGTGGFFAMTLVRGTFRDFFVQLAITGQRWDTEAADRLLKPLAETLASLSEAAAR